MALKRASEMDLDNSSLGSSDEEGDEEDDLEDEFSFADSYEDEEVSS